MRKHRNDPDALLKLLFQELGRKPFLYMHLDPVQKWLNVDLPTLKNRRVDLLGRTTAGRLLHIELQDRNDPLIAIRMAEYGLAILRAYGEYPGQVVIYIGKAKLRMPCELRTAGMLCQYRVIDIRSLSAEALLASPRVADNCLGVLAGPKDAPAGIRKALQHIAAISPSKQEDAFHQLLLTCTYRGLQGIAEEERRKMPITGIVFDPLEYDFIAEAAEKLKNEAVEKATVKAQRDLLRKLLQQRFGRLPAAITKRLAVMNPAEIDKLALALIDAKSLKDLFGSAR